MDDWTIFLDMDGVCTDFVKGALTLFDRMDLYGKVDAYLPYMESFDVSVHDFWKHIDAAGSGFWRNLEPLPWYEDMHTRLSELGKVVFLTSPARATHAASGKVAWLFDRYGADFRDFILAPEKHYCSHWPSSLLIDDQDKNVERWERAVLFPQPWNKWGCPPQPTLVVDDLLTMVRDMQRHAA